MGVSGSFFFASTLVLMERLCWKSICSSRSVCNSLASDFMNWVRSLCVTKLLSALQILSG